MTTTIHQNSGPAARVEPIEALLERLSGMVLDPTFEEYGDFVSVVGGTTHLWGGFFGNAATFRIATDDAGVVETLTNAIRANQATPDYQRVRAALAAWQQEKALLAEIRQSSGRNSSAYAEQERVCAELNPWFLDERRGEVASEPAEESAQGMTP